MKVAVIDDEPDITELIATVVQMHNWECLATSDPQILLQEAASGLDLIFLDLMMPETDGVEMLRQLGELKCKASIVLISGFDRKVLQVADDLAHSLGLKTLGRLEKPFRLQQVDEILNSANSGLPGSGRPYTPQVLLSQDDIRQALEEDLIRAFYQPQIDLQSNRVWGCEALIRIVHPQKGIIAPDAFIPVAEACTSSSLIDDLTSRILEKAFSEYARLVYDKLTLSINLSPKLLGDLSIPDRIYAEAKHYNLAPDRLIVEITETGLINERDLALDILSRLRIKGMRLSIDDYGTGYSSMAQLRTVPATELKIDRLFVKDLLKDQDCRTLVSNTIELGHHLNLKLVAEGIETPDQEAILKDLGCDIGQGYLYSRPVPLEKLSHLLNQKPEPKLYPNPNEYTA